MILQIYREAVLAGREAEYDAIEQDTAKNAARLGCPNPYLGAESLSGPTVLWFFNAYDSVAEQRGVSQSYMRNAKLVAALARNSSRKAEFTGATSDVFAHYRADAGRGASWSPGQGRFLRIIESKAAKKADGAVFETDDGIRFIVTACLTRDDAEKDADAETHVLAVRPSWSFAAPAWIAADEKFWGARGAEQ
jgi:hypothetical protein